jgi:uncharacterized protein YmfQ (DUF2313 family)
MGGSIDNYKAQLGQLLPPGKAFANSDNSKLGDLLAAQSVELARVDGRAEDMILEADPRTTNEMLPDWERVCGLPDECTGGGETVEERRQLVTAKYTQRGGQSPGFFQELAATLGYDVEIEEYHAFRVGDDTGDPAYDDDWAHAFSVLVPDETTVRYFASFSGCAGEPLATWGDDALECVITRAKPAHSTVLFAYGE